MAYDLFEALERLEKIEQLKNKNNNSVKTDKYPRRLSESRYANDNPDFNPDDIGPEDTVYFTDEDTDTVYKRDNATGNWVPIGNEQDQNDDDGDGNDGGQSGDDDGQGQGQGNDQQGNNPQPGSGMGDDEGDSGDDEGGDSGNGSDEDGDGDGDGGQQDSGSKGGKGKGDKGKGGKGGWKEDDGTPDWIDYSDVDGENDDETLVDPGDQLRPLTPEEEKEILKDKYGDKLEGGGTEAGNSPLDAIAKEDEENLYRRAELMNDEKFKNAFLDDMKNPDKVTGEFKKGEERARSNAVKYVRTQGAFEQVIRKLVEDQIERSRIKSYSRPPRQETPFFKRGSVSRDTIPNKPSIYVYYDWSGSMSAYCLKMRSFIRGILGPYADREEIIFGKDTEFYWGNKAVVSADKETDRPQGTGGGTDCNLVINKIADEDHPTNVLVVTDAWPGTPTRRVEIDGAAWFAFIPGCDIPEELVQSITGKEQNVIFQPARV